MHRDNLKTKELLKELTSGKEDKILSAFTAIRIRGNAELLPVIISLVFDEPTGAVRCEALNLLNDLKDKDSVPYIAAELIKHRGKNGFNNLVSSCWQCGLDFSEYLDLFADMVVKDNFETAIEAFTVIEENLHMLDSDRKIKLAENKLISFETTDEPKQRLLRELERIINENIRD